MAYRVQEIVAQLTIAQFGRLCSLVDQDGLGPKFKIAKIKTNYDQLLVWVDFGGARMKWYAITRQKPIRLPIPYPPYMDVA